MHNVGIHGRNFSQQNEALVTEMTRKFLDYAKSARLEAHDGDNADRRTAGSENIEIRMTSEGFPIIPELVMDKELKKAEWEKLLRAFLTQHYCKLMFQSMYRYSCSLDLASGKKFKHVPFSAIKQDTASFILNQYRPSGVILQDPRNMHLEDIRKVLKHCYVRQAESGPESAFRLAIYIGPRRKQLPAKYADTQNNNGHANNGPAEPASSRRKKDKGKQREDPLNGLLQIDQSEEPPTELDKEFGDQQNPDQDDIEVPEANLES